MLPVHEIETRARTSIMGKVPATGQVSDDMTLLRRNGQLNYTEYILEEFPLLR